MSKPLAYATGAILFLLVLSFWTWVRGIVPTDISPIVNITMMLFAVFVGLIAIWILQNN